MKNLSQKKFSRKKMVYSVLIMIILSLGLSMSLNSILALSLSPTANPLMGNIFRKTALINENNTETSTVLNAPLGVLSNFLVGTNTLFVEYGTGKIVIGGVAPNTTLDVNGLTRVGNFVTSSQPVCNSGLVGSIFFDITVNKPFVCTANSGWQSF